MSRLSEIMRLSRSYQVWIRWLTVSIRGSCIFIMADLGWWDIRVIKFLRISFVLLEGTQSKIVSVSGAVQS